MRSKRRPAPVERRRGASTARAPRTLAVADVPVGFTMRIAEAFGANRFFAPPARWGLAVVVARFGEAPRVVDRVAFAAELRANDLEALAHEAIARRVPPNHVLVYLEIDDGERAGVGFVVYPLGDGLRAAAR